MDAKRNPSLDSFAQANPEQRHLDIWRYVQRGLVYPAPYAIFATYWLKEDGITRKGLKALRTHKADRTVPTLPVEVQFKVFEHLMVHASASEDARRGWLQLSGYGRKSQKTILFGLH